MEQLKAYLALSIMNASLSKKAQFLKTANFNACRLFDDHLLEFYEWKEVELIISQCERLGIKILMVHDEEYPEILRQTVDFPPVLFCLGDTCLLKQECFAVVGTRTITMYGKAIVSRFVPPLCRANFCIVSGMASGVDAESHWSAINNDGKTIAVLGTGVDVAFPAQNKDLYKKIIKDGGLVVSEFAPGTAGFKQNFPRRNRIISGLSIGALIVEAGLQSGSLITASISASYSRDVFCVPGPITSRMSDGTNSLIKRGAIVALSSDDILEHYSLLIKGNGKKIHTTQISDGAKTLLKTLSAQGSSVSELLCSSGACSSEIFKNLEELELSGYIFRDGFGIYHLN